MRLDAYGREPADRARAVRWALVAATWAALLFLYGTWVPKHVSPLKLPGPADLVSAQRQVGDALLSHAWASLCRVLLGFSIGATLGVIVGTLMYASRSLHAVLYGVISVIAPVPPLALTPFLILWFRLSYASQVGLVALGSWLVLVYSTLHALSHVSQDVKRAAWSIGSGGARHYLDVLLPMIVPALEGDLRLALAGAIALSTVSEFMGAQQGLGVLIMVARRTLETPTILLAILMLGVMSFLLDTALRLGIWALTPWRR